jgi:hypothetical protein
MKILTAKIMKALQSSDGTVDSDRLGMNKKANAEGLNVLPSFGLEDCGNHETQ